jgi:hypothetical protein
MDEISGDGSAELLDDCSIEVEFTYHNGDEAVLKARRDTSFNSPDRSRRAHQVKYGRGDRQ